uniref:Uncharacterized protein n=1 Tax=Rhizophora mucronata TaxID=61149 RepID=A0A2P2NSN8_RHIMU
MCDKLWKVAMVWCLLYKFIAGLHEISSLVVLNISSQAEQSYMKLSSCAVINEARKY